jgi:nicotinate-nucleotide pyrophosphorylase
MEDSLTGIIKRALEEDIQQGDITTIATISEELKGKVSSFLNPMVLWQDLRLHIKFLNLVDPFLILDSLLMMVKNILQEK